MKFTDRAEIGKIKRTGEGYLITQARAGSEARIGDNAKPWGAAPLTKTEEEPDMAEMKTVVVGGNGAWA